MRIKLEDKIDRELAENPAFAKVYVTDLLVQYLERLYRQTGNFKEANKIYEAIEFYIKQFRKHRNKDRKATLKGLFTAMDEIQAGDNSEMRKYVSCKKGCSFCCHINVDIYDDEAEVILNYCKKNNIAIDVDYLKKQAEFKDLRSHARNELSACVFLKNGLCSIYPVRPIACRKFAVISPPAKCEAAHNTSEVLIYFDLHIEVLASAFANIAKGANMQKTLLKYLEDEQQPTKETH